MNLRRIKRNISVCILIEQAGDQSLTGVKYIKMQLERDDDAIMNHKKIRRIMRKYNLVAKVRQANPYRKMAKATQEHKTCPNLLECKFNQEEPGKVLLTDITYMRYRKGQWAYLSW